MKKTVVNQFRQGDVLITPRAVPAEAERVAAGGRIVLAEGEATGHAHAILATDDAEMLRRDADTYLRVKSPVEVRHEEHGSITVPPGEYLIRRQVESWMDEVRQVAD